jgi:hypothetical protein
MTLVTKLHLRVKYTLDTVVTVLYSTSIMKTKAQRHSDDATALNLRDVPRDLIACLKAAAAFAHKPLKEYVVTVLRDHVNELEKKGTLPKGKS